MFSFLIRPICAFEKVCSNSLIIMHLKSAEVFFHWNEVFLALLCENLIKDIDTSVIPRVKNTESTTSFQKCRLTF